MNEAMTYDNLLVVVSYMAEFTPHPGIQRKILEKNFPQDGQKYDRISKH